MQWVGLILAGYSVKAEDASDGFEDSGENYVDSGFQRSFCHQTGEGMALHCVL